MGWWFFSGAIVVQIASDIKSVEFFEPLTKCQVDNINPSDVCYGRAEEIKTRRERVTRRTIRESNCLHQLPVQGVFLRRKVPS